MMCSPVIECVPNFSEGRDDAKIAQIVAALESVAGAQVLNVDSGWDMNRTVVTFVGSPASVAEAAFRSIAKAAELIDMSRQHGLHPRIGATDVFPFVPIEGITLAECAEIARQVGRRVGDELKIPIYLYEAAATIPERTNLATIRHGEYEGLAKKIEDPHWKPDFGPAIFNAQTGATVLGAREFLVAYNITLNTREKIAAEDIAFELRERGRFARSRTDSPYYHRGELLHYQKGSFPCGNCDFVGTTFAETETHCRDVHGYELRALAKEDFAHVVSENDLIGKKVRRAGKFKFCKAIGWYAEAFRRAQISINLTNIRVTSPHLVLEEARKLAAERGLIVTGSEIVGMIPYAALFEAGKFYLRKQGVPTNVAIRQILETAVFSMGLDDVQAFEIEEKVLGLPSEAFSGTTATNRESLLRLSLHDLIDEIARPTPAPAGGSVAALAGALGAALATMCAKIANSKEILDLEKKTTLTRIVERSQAAKLQLMAAVDEDEKSYSAYLDALRLAKATKVESTQHDHEVQNALKKATETPLQAAELGLSVLEDVGQLAEVGLFSTMPDIALAGEMAYTAVRGSLRNVAANLHRINDLTWKHSMEVHSAEMLDNALRLHQKIEKAIDG
jgi:glutamate formiminotransferase/formiminotetrahydrofolate cyclodeaminase